MLGAKRKAVDHVLIRCLDIASTVARLCTNIIIFCRFTYNGSAPASINVHLNEEFILLILHDLYLYCIF